MGFHNGCILKVWKITRREAKYTDLQCSASSKDKNGKYQKDWNGFVRLLGKAFEETDVIVDKMADEDGCLIKMISGDVKTNYTGGKNYTNYTCFECEVLSGNVENTPQASEPIEEVKEQPPATGFDMSDMFGDDDSLPF